MKEKEFISVVDACEHNLKHLSLDLPKDSFVVFTGVSGSGKSSLAFDTIYAEGRRRFLDSLSVYARQFVGELKRSKVRELRGIGPAVAIDQATATNNPRSTVGTMTEIYDYMRLLWGRAGVQMCPDCQIMAGTLSLDEMVDALLREQGKAVLYAPIVSQKKGRFEKELDAFVRAGFAKARIDGEIRDLHIGMSLAKTVRHDIDLIVDRWILGPKANRERLRESLNLALLHGKGKAVVEIEESGEKLIFGRKSMCPKCGRGFPPLNPNALAFNSPQGMCPQCFGTGETFSVDLSSLIIDANQPFFAEDLKNSACGPLSDFALSSDLHQGIREGIESYIEGLEHLDRYLKHQLSKTPWITLDPYIKYLLLEPIRLPSGDYHPIVSVMHSLYEDFPDEDFFSPYVKTYPCPACSGHRLKIENQNAYFASRSICEVNAMTVRQALDFFENIARDNRLSEIQNKVAEEVLPSLLSRLRFVRDVGLAYLRLDRSGITLSGGESQRIRLATLLGSGMTGVTYVLDEPSIGLHARDQSKLIDILKQLRDKGNSVYVVEHDEATMLAADCIIDIGPDAGVNGGELVFSGSLDAMRHASYSLTAQYLFGQRSVEIPESRKQAEHFIRIRGACKNNLKNVDVDIPVGCLTCVTGVSGSGKSTLINEILLPAAKRGIRGFQGTLSPYADAVTGLEVLDRVIEVDQKAIGRTPRSNPATYTKVFDVIRQFFAVLPDSRAYGYSQSRYSFNVSSKRGGGRCDLCEGSGVRTIEMRFLANSYIECEQCLGKRFNDATLRVRYNGHSISDVLNLSFDDALRLFEAQPKIAKILRTVCDVGLGYIKLGQPSPTLSGGESQRMKLSRELARTSKMKTLYILDEPSTGLHFEDIRRLMHIIRDITAAGHTVVIIEHNLDIIKSADHVIDMGPEGGNEGGNVVCCGTPEEIAAKTHSHTGRFLRDILHDNIANGA